MIKFKSEYFNIEDTLFCGQLFRFFKKDNGYIVQSRDKACFLYYDGDYTVIDSFDDEYFYNYFDLDRDYQSICSSAIAENIPFLAKAAASCKGLRLLRQDKFETLYEFVISQNNNIPRIKLTIEKLCEKVGEKFDFHGETLYAFPTAQNLKALTEVDYQALGFGYRAAYFTSLAPIVSDEYVAKLNELNTEELKCELLKLKGIGPKVCDCVSLFGFLRTDSFPVDTWVEKLYREDLKGELTNREKISHYFVDRFKNNAGFYQQYMFYYKRGK